MSSEKQLYKEEYLTVPEAAKMLRVRERTIYRYLADGVITRRKVKGRTLILRKELQRLLGETS